VRGVGERKCTLTPILFPIQEDQNHVHALNLHFMFYNFARIHQTLRVTPAMQAGVANYVWTIEEIIGLLD